MKKSVILTSRNDDYGGNLHKRTTMALTSLIEHHDEVVFVDWKTKWHDYDLRISIHAPEHLQNLADDIESGFYSRGKQKELVEQILKLDSKASIIWGSIERFEKQLEELENKQNES